MRSPAPTPRLGGGEVGHKGCSRPPLRSPADPETRGQGPRSRDQPCKNPLQPEPGEGLRGSAAGPGGRSRRGRVTARVPIAVGALPSREWVGRGGQRCSRDWRLVPGPSTRRPVSAKGLGRGGGRGGETHVLHGRGHVVVALRLLGQPGFLHQLLAVHHLRGLGRAGRGDRGDLKGSEGGCGAAGARVPEGPTHEASSRGDDGGAETMAGAATAGPGARRLRLLCVPRADNPLRPRPRRVTQPAPPRPRPGPSASRASPPQLSSRPFSGRPPLPPTPCQGSPFFTSPRFLRPSFPALPYKLPPHTSALSGPARGPLGVVVHPAVG